MEAMERSEIIVKKYLLGAGYTDIVHEPDGKVSPDFLVNRQIAVEVRRLNQNEETATGHRGLEETSIPISRRIPKLLDSLGLPARGSSWFVWYSIKRPVPPRNELERAMREALLAFRYRPNQQRTHICLSGLTIEIVPASNMHPTFFVLGGSGDQDAGGFVLGEMQRNLKICVAEKSAKVARVRHRYPEWWLALVDYIGYGLEGGEQDQLRQIVRLEHSWDKIVIVNPRNPQEGFAL
ncbi:MAG: hypothetical protein E6J74_23760 [Deltaproteobacteria bacterium]|nr:MAG: hypothetical protein E6J74_23760 [Deltaproteobacteria bacterium]